MTFPFRLQVFILLSVGAVIPSTPAAPELEPLFLDATQDFNQLMRSLNKKTGTPKQIAKNRDIKALLKQRTSPSVKTRQIRVARFNDKILPSSIRHLTKPGETALRDSVQINLFADRYFTLHNLVFRKTKKQSSLKGYYFEYVDSAKTRSRKKELIIPLYKPRDKKFSRHIVPIVTLRSEDRLFRTSYLEQSGFVVIKEMSDVESDAPAGSTHH